MKWKYYQFTDEIDATVKC